MVVHLLRNLLDPCGRNPIPLLDGQRMVRCLKFDKRSSTDSTSVNRRLEMKRFGITRNRIAEPAEVCGFRDSVRVVPKIGRPVEVFLAQ